MLHHDVAVQCDAEAHSATLGARSDFSCRREQGAACRAQLTTPSRDTPGPIRSDLTAVQRDRKRRRLGPHRDCKKETDPPVEAEEWAFCPQIW